MSYPPDPPHNPYGGWPPPGQPPAGPTPFGHGGGPPMFGQAGGPAMFGQGGGPLVADDDPLISRDYAGWWRRAIAIVKVAWPKLLLLQVINLAFGVVTMAVYAVLFAPVLKLYGQLLEALQRKPEPDPAELDRILNELANSSNDGLVALITLPLSLFAAGLGLVIFVASIRVATEAATTGRADVGPALRWALGRSLPMLGWGLLGGLMLYAGLLCCFVPGIYFGLVLVTLPAVVAFERGTGIGRSFGLFHQAFGAALGRGATILGLYVGTLGIGYILLFALSGITSMATGGLSIGGLAAALGAQVVLLMAFTVILPVLIVLTYADLRARVESLSADVLKREIGIS